MNYFPTGEDYTILRGECMNSIEEELKVVFSDMQMYGDYYSNSQCIYIQILAELVYNKIDGV